jgi:hypothetical protein
MSCRWRGRMRMYLDCATLTLYDVCICWFLKEEEEEILIDVNRKGTEYRFKV